MFAKGAIIERCLRRVLEIYGDDPNLADLLHLDALTLNVERACQAAIDLALHVVAMDVLHAVASVRWKDFVELCHAVGLEIVVIAED
jgi:hypothetical protein